MQEGEWIRASNWELIFYWYQSRGRVIASEYAGKFWMMADAISRNRTDGSLVRLIHVHERQQDRHREIDPLKTLKRHRLNLFFRSRTNSYCGV